MKGNQSNRKIYIILGVIGIVLYGLFKLLQTMAGLTVGGSFGVGLGGMSGSQRLTESRKVETDAPTQVIYHIDEHRFLTLENYIACDKGGQVYYNDIQRGVKTLLGWDIDFNDFSYRRGNNVSAYQGVIINGADNGYLAFPGAVTAQYCGSGNSSTGCPVFIFFSADYGKTFIYRIIAKEYNTPVRFSKLKVMVANDGVYLRDESEPEPAYNNIRRYDYIFRVTKYRFDNDMLINVYGDWDEKIERLIKEELIRKNIPYADKYGPDFDFFDYARKITPPKTNEEINAMADEYSDIASVITKRVYKDKITFPSLPMQSIANKYSCDKAIKAKTITYISKNGRAEVVKNDQ